MKLQCNDIFLDLEDKGLCINVLANGYMIWNKDFGSRLTSDIKPEHIELILYLMFKKGLLLSCTYKDKTYNNMEDFSFNAVCESNWKPKK